MGNGGPLGDGALGQDEGPQGGLGEEKGRLREAARRGSSETFAGLLGASPVCGPHRPSPLHHASPRHSLAPFPTVLPGGCPACDTHALQGALLCLEHHYAALPLPSGAPFNGSHTFLEDAADTGALAIALQVTHAPRARISFYRPLCRHSYKAFCPSHPH